MNNYENDHDVVREGEKVMVPFSLRDSARRAPSPLAGRTLRCLDTGRVSEVDAANAAAIASEAAKAGLPAETYLRTRLRYSLEN